MPKSYQTILTYLTLYYEGISYKKCLQILEHRDPEFDILQYIDKIEFDYPEATQRARSYLKSHASQIESILHIGHPDYPNELYKLDHPPCLLFLRGNKNLLTQKRVSMVGSRKPCLLSVALTAHIAKYFSEAGYVTVSGLAAGIDGIVHENSLEGGTIAVLGHGFNYIYPKQHEHFYKMAKQQSKDILILTEHPDDTIPRHYLFPKRNRIIAALGESLFFLNGGKKSGALISVKEAQKLQKSTFYMNHSLQKNNEGVRQIRLSGKESTDITKDFPLTIKTQLCKEDFKENPRYIGNSRWVFINRENFSQLPFLPAQADLCFPE